MMTDRYKSGSPYFRLLNHHIPFYRLEMTKNDLVIVRPRTGKTALAHDIILSEWAEEKARGIALVKDWGYYVLRSNWMAFAKD